MSGFRICWAVLALLVPVIRRDVSLTQSDTMTDASSVPGKNRQAGGPVLTDADKLLKLLAQSLDVRTTEVCSVVLTTPTLLEF